jgi:flagellar biosynthesis/type III secretory pathway protein FliH
MEGIMSTFYDDGYCDAEAGLPASPTGKIYRTRQNGKREYSDIYTAEYMLGYEQGQREETEEHRLWRIYHSKEMSFETYRQQTRIGVY